jgi:hypothetical protein
MTRLLWTVIFVLITAVLLLSLARSWTVGRPLNRRLVAIARSGEELDRRFPGHRFRVQVSSPGPGRREVVLSIQPGPADSALLAVLPDSAADWLLGRLDLEGFDSLRVALFDSVVRTRPLGRTD